MQIETNDVLFYLWNKVVPVKDILKPISFNSASWVQNYSAFPYCTKNESGTQLSACHLDILSFETAMFWSFKFFFSLPCTVNFALLNQTHAIFKDSRSQWRNKRNNGTKAALFDESFYSFWWMVLESQVSLLAFCS